MIISVMRSVVVVVVFVVVVFVVMVVVVVKLMSKMTMSVHRMHHPFDSPFFLIFTRLFFESNAETFAACAHAPRPSRRTS